MLANRSLAHLVVAVVTLVFASTLSAGIVERVIFISVDGLSPDAVTELGPEKLPNLYRMRTEGAITDNARTDYDYTNTLPNHTCMITGRAVAGDAGHNWIENGAPTQTIHENKGAYIASMFDVAHDAGLHTAMFTSKIKFSVYDDSYDADSDQDAAHGADTLDVYQFETSGSGGRETGLPAVKQCLAELSSKTYDLTMLHIRDPDTVGHDSGWMSIRYLGCVRRVDRMIGLVLDFVEGHPDYTGKTVVILTTDHGGSELSHGNAKLAEAYTIPFYIWGAGVSAGADLYQLNGTSRSDPGDRRPNYLGPQPIRNGDAGNLALALLDLKPIPGSTINMDQSLSVSTEAHAVAE